MEYSLPVAHAVATVNPKNNKSKNVDDTVSETAANTSEIMRNEQDSFENLPQVVGYAEMVTDPTIRFKLTTSTTVQTHLWPQRIAPATLQEANQKMILWSHTPTGSYRGVGK